MIAGPASPIGMAALVGAAGILAPALSGEAVGFAIAPIGGGEAEGEEEGLFRSWQAWRRPTLPCLETEYHRR